ncbi:MAG TPA: hypothetical protein VNA14_03000 [Mycobacteriales bacterium]|nr:hypothetical protein [Mycobacteriales bacterium]
MNGPAFHPGDKGSERKSRPHSHHTSADRHFDDEALAIKAHLRGSRGVARPSDFGTFSD